MRNYTAILTLVAAMMYPVSAVNASVQLVSAELSGRAYAEIVGGMIDEHSAADSSSPFGIDAQAGVSGQDAMGESDVLAKVSQGFFYGPNPNPDNYYFSSIGDLLTDVNGDRTGPPGVVKAESTVSYVFTVTDQTVGAFFDDYTDPHAVEFSYDFDLIALNTNATLWHRDMSPPAVPFPSVLNVGTYQFNATWRESYSGRTFSGYFGSARTGFFLGLENVPELPSLATWSALGLAGAMTCFLRSRRAQSGSQGMTE